MSRTYRMALDQGTTSSRCIIFDKEGRTVAVAAREFPQHFPHTGYICSATTKIRGCLKGSDTSLCHKVICINHNSTIHGISFNISYL